ncbi:MAG: recombinase family protein [Elusimicrobiota bacterium]
METPLNADEAQITPKVCAVYVRCSTPQPKLDKPRPLLRHTPQEESIPRQKEQLGQWYRNLGIIEPQVFFADDETGKNRNRPQLRELIRWIENGKVGVLMLYHDSRAARDKLLTEELMTLCFHRNIDVYLNNG